MTQPVVVTGVGVLSGLGSCPDRVWRAALRGQTDHFQSAVTNGYRIPICSLVPAFHARRYLSRKQARFLIRDVTLGFAASERALTDAGFEELGNSDAWGCFVGAPSNFGDPEDYRDAFHASRGPDGNFDFGRFAAEGRMLLNPFALLKALANGLVYSISVRHVLRGHNMNFSGGGVSSTHALGAALRALREGRIDRALVSGYDGVPSGMAMIRSGRFRGGRTLPVRAAMRGRAVLYPGEAAVAFVLERRSDALRRGARPRAELAGFGAGFESPQAGVRGRGTRAAIDRALSDGRTRPAEIDYVHTDGIRGLCDWQDLTESLAGLARERPVPVSSTTFATGYAPAAAGTLGVFFATRAVAGRRLPPMAGARSSPHPKRDLPFEVVRSARGGSCRTALVTTGDLLGARAAVVVRREERRAA